MRRPDLHGNVTRIVAVMGHQPGHLFHPTESKGPGAQFGHGPIFRDLNRSVDPGAARAVLAMNLPTTLIPFDAAQGTLITGPDLDLLTRHRPRHRVDRAIRRGLAGVLKHRCRPAGLLSIRLGGGDLPHVSAHV